MSEIEELKEVLKKVKEREPVVVQITNFVSASFQADCTLAVGAHAIMPVSSLEIGDILSRADALLLNIGTLDEIREKSILKGFKMAKERGIPVVLDPVGCGVSPFRRELTLKLLVEGGVSLVKGNYGEIISLYGRSGLMKGVDSDLKLNGVSFEDVVKELSSIYSCVFVATGKVNYISDGKSSLSLPGGERVMRYVSGLGCSLGSVMASFLTVLSPLDASLYALKLFSEVSRRAWAKSRGPGSFKVSFIDELYLLGRGEDED